MAHRTHKCANVDSMNRPIKFRAWDTAIGRMFMLGTISDLLLLQEDTDSESWLIDNNEAKLMQFTGLLDKNGIEIYEGDIIQITPKWVFEMKWGNEQARYYLQSGLVNVKTARGTIRPRVAQAAHDARKGEIIGNVWENPELLT